MATKETAKKPIEKKTKSALIKDIDQYIELIEKHRIIRERLSTIKMEYRRLTSGDSDVISELDVQKEKLIKIEKVLNDRIVEASKKLKI